MSSTRISHHVNAPREKVYRALLDADAISKWMVPDGMTSEVHAFEAREGGSFRISLTYDSPGATGKTSAAALYSSMSRICGATPTSWQASSVSCSPDYSR